MTEPASRFSLLFADPTEPNEILYGEEVLSFLPLPSEESDREKIQSILARKTTRKDIVFRKEIMEDFLQYPSLLERTETILRNRNTLFQIAKRERKADGKMSWEEALGAVKENAVSLMEHLKFLKHSSDLMAKETPSSEGLFSFSEYLRRKATDSSIKSLTEQIAAYPLLRNETVYTVLQIHLNRYGMKSGADVAFLGSDESKFKKKNPPRKDIFSVCIPKTEAPKLTAEALIRLANRFCNLSEEIRKAFSPLEEGLAFYRFGLSIIERATEKGHPWQFAVPVDQYGPTGKCSAECINSQNNRTRSLISCSSRPLEFYRGTFGTLALKTAAVAQIFSAAGLPLIGTELYFCPEQRVVVYTSEGKTIDDEIPSLAKIFHNTRQGDIILLHQPLITVGNAPATEIIKNLLRAFHKKGALVRISSDLSME